MDNGDQSAFTLRDFAEILQRRVWWAILPATIILLASLAAALLLPPAYRSEAIFLLDESNNRSDVVSANWRSFADQRIQLVYQKITASVTLETIIDDFGLYSEARLNSSTEEIVRAMRKDIAIEYISAEIKHPQGEGGEATIAIKLSFEYENPEIAKRVTDKLVALLSEENEANLRKRASETLEFLTQEARLLGQNLAQIDSSLADLRHRNAGGLPEQLDQNLTLLEIAKEDLRELRRVTRELRQRQVLLDARLAETSPYLPREVDGEVLLTPDDRLTALKTRLVNQLTVYSPQHPDVQRTRREIRDLERVVADNDKQLVAWREQAKVKAELVLARQDLGEDHPRVKRLEERVSAWDREIVGDRGEARATEQGRPDNPVYLEAQTELVTIEAELLAVDREQADVMAQIDEYESRIAETPRVEREYQPLVRTREAISTEYAEMQQKLTDARLLLAMEREQIGGQFTLLEAPRIPMKRSGPNRRLIVAAGLAVAIAIGLAVVILAEALDTRIYTVRDVSSMRGTPPLGIVPLIEKRAHRRRNCWAWAGACGIVLLGVVALIWWRAAPSDNPFGNYVTSLLQQMGEFAMFNETPSLNDEPGR